MAGPCEYNNEPLGSIKRVECLDWLRNYQLFKKHSFPPSWLTKNYKNSSNSHTLCTLLDTTYHLPPARVRVHYHVKYRGTGAGAGGGANSRCSVGASLLTRQTFKSGPPTAGSGTTGKLFGVPQHTRAPCSQLQHLGVVSNGYFAN